MTPDKRPKRDSPQLQVYKKCVVVDDEEEEDEWKRAKADAGESKYDVDDHDDDRISSKPSSSSSKIKTAVKLSRATTTKWTSIKPKESRDEFFEPCDWCEPVIAYVNPRSLRQHLQTSHEFHESRVMDTCGICTKLMQKETQIAKSHWDDCKKKHQLKRFDVDPDHLLKPRPKKGNGSKKEEKIPNRAAHWSLGNADGEWS